MTLRYTMVRALALTAMVAGCSSKSSDPGPGEFLFDAGPTGDSARDTAPFDGGPLDDSTTGDTFGDARDANDASSDGKTDGTIGIDTAPVDSGPTPLCPTGYSDLPGTAVTYPHGPSELLAAITWDELTMSWTTEESSAITIHYSDRSAHDDAFIADHVLPASLGPFGHDKVALTADGLTMLFMSADQQTVSRITRSARGALFDPTTVTTAPFTRLTGSGGQGGGAPKRLADLVLSKDDSWLFYSSLDRTSGPTIMLSVKLSDGSWDAPNPIDATRLEMDSGFRRRPTGISSDKRTLFYFDEASEATYVAFRVWDTALFDEFIGYAPTGERAMPADSCSRVYLTMEIPDKGDAGSDASIDDGSDPATTKAIFHAP